MTRSPEPTRGPSDDRLRSVLHALSMPVAIVDADGCWQQLNPAFERLLGRDATSVLGTCARDCIEAGARDRFDADLVELVRDAGAEREREMVFLGADGGQARARIRLAPMGDASSAHQGVLLQSLEDRRAGGRHPLQMFADAIAHDLRAPLRSIDSFAGLLARRAAERLDDTDRDHLARIRAAAGRMTGLLAALSDLSLAMRAEIRPGLVDMSLLAEWVGAELSEADPGRAVALVVQPGLLAQGDERLLKLMLAQVLGNAWRFSKNCNEPRIEVEGEVVGDRLRMRVRDRGCGFDMQYAHKLFEPFQRLHGPDQGAGHGLGLAIARSIVQRHGGRIDAQSRPEAGSVFTIELPAPAAPGSASHA